MSKKYYAVKKGPKPGLYTDWPTVQKMLKGYSKPEFKGFNHKQAALEYLNGTAPSVSQDDITIYTDGGSRNTGNKRDQHVKGNDKSAWAYLIVINGKEYPGTGFEWGATNNRMEMMALVQALKWLLAHHLNHASITEVADSRYLLNAITKGWIYGWKRRGWRLSSGGPVKNAELWAVMYRLLRQFDHLKFKWTKGHATNRGNNFVDHYLNEAMDRHTKHSTIQHQTIQTCRSNNEPKSAKPYIIHGSNSIEDIKRELRKRGFLQN
ncbi:ribonuclease H family protein [Acetilactobacillus jinshanensis]|uniref:ribonuclease H n=1 Tax=Acetilactobacillus jinshanensis TaxID=1720083 RepID=A0A4P6ZJP0_9LACO|nr:ribonuclease H family protein [Acetilactobacillus jinshanensis]QBP17753.1 hypothetical protein ELX58_00870 [Acetilactobacillus jinshanensis]URL60615.1 hypothetical protein HGK75_00890 [uncultured bacterium]